MIIGPRRIGIGAVRILLAEDSFEITPLYSVSLTYQAHRRASHRGVSCMKLIGVHLIGVHLIARVNSFLISGPEVAPTPSCSRNWDPENIPGTAVPPHVPPHRYQRRASTHDRILTQMRGKKGPRQKNMIAKGFEPSISFESQFEHQ